MQEIRNVKAQYVDLLLKKRNAVGCGVGYKETGGARTGELCIIVSVVEKMPMMELDRHDLIPQVLSGIKTDVQETGVIHALQGRTGKWRPAPGGVSVGHACYDNQTRVLTSNGLKFFRDIIPSDKVATLKNGKELEYQHPLKTYQYDYEGDMIHFKGKTIDLLVTPNHKIYYKNRYSPKPFRLGSAEKVLQSNAYGSVQFKRNCEWYRSAPPTSFTVPPQSKSRKLYEAFMSWKGSIASFARQHEVSYGTAWRWRHGVCKPRVCQRPLTFSIDDWLQFLGWYLSEGSSFVNDTSGTIVLSEKSGRYHNEITALLDRMRIKWCIAKTKAIQFSYKELAMYLKQFGTATQKYIPIEIKDLPASKLQILLQSLMRGDGHFENGKYRHYKTASWQLANDVLEIALKCGYGVTIQKEIPNPHRFKDRIIAGGTSYRIGFSHVKLTPRFAREPARVSYKGKIYCLEVPNHVLFVERNGKTCWSGNSISAGTLGCIVSKDEQAFILSNNHVLADSNQAQLGDTILQPGPADGGTLADAIATLEDYMPINFESGIPFCPFAKGIVSVLNWLAMCVGSRHRFLAIQDDPEPNLVDAAIARPLSADLVVRHILEIGEPQGINEGTLGLKIRKSGRTTGLTSGEITQIDATVKVSYGIGKTAIFVDQLVAGEMSAGGDSGSAVLDEDNRVVGLLFAGSETTTVLNRIQNVMIALDVNIA